MSSDDEGQPLSIDSDAESASPDLPAFLARPEGAPVYHGFRVLEGAVVDGFTFGTITAIDSEGTDLGDAFVIAPDGSRCGLVWDVADEPYVRECRGFEPGRWGVWYVGFPFVIRSTEDARRNLEAILPLLRPKWEAWRAAGYGT